MSNARFRSGAAGDLRAPDFAPDRPCSELRELFAPLDRLLVSGGDARLDLDPRTGRNAYGCSPSPRGGMTSFSSSTATTISQRGFERAGRARDRLMEAAIAVGLVDAFDTCIEATRSELKDCLGLHPSGADVVFSASGTDAQIQALFLVQSILGLPLTTVIVGADQTGSGTSFTALGRHFSDRTSLGARVRKGEPIEGLAGSVTSLAVPLTQADGSSRSVQDIDGQVVGMVERAIAGGARVLLQTMDSSKLGWRAPSDECLRQIADRWPGSVQVVVDACQMRLGRSRLARYLDRGFMVLLTGSKFFAGPPFSGALLVPGSMAGEIGAIAEIPPGLRDYSCRTDWPARWSALRGCFPGRPNFGQWLRWEAALGEISAYYRLPEDFRRSAERELGVGIARLIEASPSLRPLPAEGRDGDDNLDGEMAWPTIFPFRIERRGRALAAPECRDIYRALAGREDASPIGQPVVLGRGEEAPTALRMSIDARQVSESWCADDEVARRNLRSLLDDAATSVAQIETLVGQSDRQETRAGVHEH